MRRVATLADGLRLLENRLRIDQFAIMKSQVQILLTRMLRWHWTDALVVYCFHSALNKILSPTMPNRVVCERSHPGVRG